MKSRLRSLVYVMVWLLSLFLLITILAVSGLLKSQETARELESKARAIMEMKASAISTIMLDPALPETRKVFSDAENSIRLQADALRTISSAKPHADFITAMHQWSHYDEASRRLMADAAHKKGDESKAQVLALYHAAFKPLENTLNRLSTRLIAEADKASAVAREQSRIVFWFLLPLLILICSLVAILMVVMQRQEARTRAILDTAVEAIMQVDENGYIMEANPACEHIFGHSRDELVGANVRSLMPASFLEQNEAKLIRAMPVGRGKPGGKSLEVQGLRKDGSTFPAEITIGETRIGGRRVFMGVVKDITERKRAEQELRIAAITFETHEGIIITDAEKYIMRANHAFTAVTGYTSEDVIGKKASILRSGQHPPEFYEEMNRMLASHGYWKGEICNRKKNGDLYYGWLTITSVTDDHGARTHYVGTIADISAHKEAEQEILNMAYYDPLTQLANRRQLHERLEQSLAASKRDGRYGALLYLDMDRFKTLNDTLGHQYGDMLLCEVARRLQQCVRTEDTVARLGGDEFCVMFENLDTDEQEACTKASIAAEKIVHALGEPYDLADQRHDSSASIGVALYRGGNSEDVINRADTAMYEAKHAGKGTWRLATQAAQA